MRTATEHMLAPVAVPTKRLEAGREASPLQIGIRAGATPLYRAAMLGAIIGYVVDRQEYLLGLTAAGAGPTVVRKDLLAQAQVLRSDIGGTARQANGNPRPELGGRAEAPMPSTPPSTGRSDRSTPSAWDALSAPTIFLPCRLTLTAVAAIAGPGTVSQKVVLGPKPATPRAPLRTRRADLVFRLHALRPPPGHHLAEITCLAPSTQPVGVARGPIEHRAGFPLAAAPTPLARHGASICC